MKDNLNEPFEGNEIKAHTKEDKTALAGPHAFWRVMVKLDQN